MPRKIEPLHIIRQMNDEHLRKAIYHLEAYIASHEWDEKDYQIVKAAVEPIIGNIKEELQ